MSFCLLPLNVNLSKSVNRNLADDSLKSILEVPAHLFTVLLCCLAALDLIGDTKDQGGPLWSKRIFHCCPIWEQFM